MDSFISATTANQLSVFVLVQVTFDRFARREEVVEEDEDDKEDDDDGAD